MKIDSTKILSEVDDFLASFFTDDIFEVIDTLFKTELRKKIAKMRVSNRVMLRILVLVTLIILFVFVGILVFSLLDLAGL